uniref:TauD/TfdA-like domain-containing protein n=1 Tax=Globisporangium ultimum (strain ATCC 200006 / CBS 805.95 / DAOM BR144) TaxID=431595 RepID=K3WUI5_GLOUD
MRAVISRALPRAAAAAVGASSLAPHTLAPQGLRYAASGGEGIDVASACSATWLTPRRGFATNEFIAQERLDLGAEPLGLLGMDIQTRDYISLKWTDGRISRFHLMHLRSWCLCPECQHETGQRLVNSSDIDPDLEIEDIFIKGSTVNIVWAGSGHKSSFPWSWLRENCYSGATLDQNAKDLTTTMLLPSAPVPMSEYAEVMDTEDDQGLFGLLHQIVENGLAVVQNTPSEKGQVKKIAERIAPVSHSFLYGDIFDVVAEQNPVNIAYTTHHLKHHLDLAYYESPPGFQFLHALRFDETVQGGESTFVDVFAVAQEFRRLHPKHFETFCRVPATFKKHHLNRSNPAIMEYQRPHIQLNHRDEVIAVHWSPPFEGPLKVPFDDVKPYYEAYKIFHDIVEGGKFQVEFKLKQGDTVIFNQRRVLHGRNQFTADSNGVRHLQGTYINIDDAHCRFNALRHRFAVDDPSIKNRRVANGNFA